MILDDLWPFHQDFYQYVGSIYCLLFLVRDQVYFERFYNIMLAVILENLLGEGRG